MATGLWSNWLLWICTVPSAVGVAKQVRIYPLGTACGSRHRVLARPSSLQCSSGYPIFISEGSTRSRLELECGGHHLVPQGELLIPQHKLWLAGTGTVGSTVWNVNGGICQNRSGDPIHWHAALGLISELSSNWILHAEGYAQPEGNGAVQIGLEHHGEVFHKIFMLMASPGFVPGTTFVGHTIH